jgi:DNA-directed RNA polymerase specialized sigma subunit
MSDDMVGTKACLRAVYELRDRHQRPPTAEEVSNYLQTTTETALRQLRELKRERIFDDRRRQSKRVWMLWADAH